MAHSVRVYNCCGTFPPPVSHLPTFSRVPRGRPGRRALGCGARLARSLVPRFSSVPCFALGLCSLPPASPVVRLSGEIVQRKRRPPPPSASLPNVLSRYLLCVCAIIRGALWGFGSSTAWLVLLWFCSVLSAPLGLRCAPSRGVLLRREIRSLALRFALSLRSLSARGRVASSSLLLRSRSAEAPLRSNLGLLSVGAGRSWWLGFRPDPGTRAPTIWFSHFFFLRLAEIISKSIAYVRFNCAFQVLFRLALVFAVAGRCAVICRFVAWKKPD